MAKTPWRRTSNWGWLKGATSSPSTVRHGPNRSQLAVNVPTIVPALERLFGFQIMPGDVYYVTKIPSDLQVTDVVAIALAALALTGLATLYPARRAARVHPARALRYD